MGIFEIFSKLSVVVQLALILGILALIFLLACSRRASENLIFFAYCLRSLLGKNRRSASHNNKDLKYPRRRRKRV